MKRHAIILICGALSIASAALAQTVAAPPPTVEITGTFKLNERNLKPGSLEQVVQQLESNLKAATAEAKAIDAFVKSRFEIVKEDKAVSSLPADTIVRRLYLDIVGRHPTPDEMQEFIKSDDPQKQAKLVDALVKEQSMPKLVYGPGAGEAWITGTLHLTGMKPLDALAIIATASGCVLQPVYSPPRNGEEKNHHIVAYAFVRLPGQVIQSAPRVRKEGEAENENVTGIGIALQDKDGNIVVSSVLPGSPADRIKTIKPGDRILRVSEEGKDEVEVTGLPLMKVTELIRGQPGTTVRLTLLSESPGGDVRHAVTLVSLTREKLNLAPTSAAYDYASVTLDGGTLNTATTVPASTWIASPSGSPYTGTTVPNVVTMKPLLAATASAPNEELSVRIYALGAMLLRDEKEMAEKEQNLQRLITDAIGLVETRPGQEPKLYFHDKSRVLVAKATTKQHEIIEQAVNAMKEVDKLIFTAKENEARQSLPKKQ